MFYFYNSNVDTERTTVVVVTDDVLVADNSHLNWDKIVAELESGAADEAVLADLFNPAAGIEEALTSDRSTFVNGKWKIDGKVQDSVMANAIVRWYEQGEDAKWKPLVAFGEKVMDNPNPHSRENLMRWLEAEDFSVTNDGLIVGYKSLYDNGDGTLRSTFSGYAEVNGIPQNGYIVQKIGDTVSMPRDYVTHDPNAACSAGLHVGTWGYASSYSGNVKVMVTVNPADVVSVPVDSGGSKMRTSKYTLDKVVERKVETPVYEDDLDDDFDDEVETCGNCGNDLDYWGDCHYGCDDE